MIAVEQQHPRKSFSPLLKADPAQPPLTWIPIPSPSLPRIALSLTPPGPPFQGVSSVETMAHRFALSLKHSRVNPCQYFLFFPLFSHIKLIDEYDACVKQGSDTRPPALHQLRVPRGSRDFAFCCPQDHCEGGPCFPRSNEEDSANASSRSCRKRGLERSMSIHLVDCSAEPRLCSCRCRGRWNLIAVDPTSSESVHRAEVDHHSS